MRATLERPGPIVQRAPGRGRWLGYGLVVLAAGLTVNSLLGPLVAGVITYPLTETLMNQTIGLEVFSLAVVAPLSLVAGILALRGHRAAPVLAFGLAAYTVYMFLQYVVGPEYAYYPGVMPFHLGLFVLGGLLTVGAWSAIAGGDLPEATRKTERRRAVLLFGLAAFLSLRYAPMFLGALRGEPLAGEFLEGVSMFWSIVLLDIGVVLPATVVVGIALLAGTAWARKATFALIGWWALVPPSVAAMAIVMLVNEDPHADAGQTMVFVVGALAFAAFAARLYRPLFARASDEGGRPS